MKKVLALAIVIGLLVSSFTTIKSNSFAFAISVDPILGIQISIDGNVVGSDAISRNGETYTLLSDLSDPITIMRNNVTVNGNGHSIIGQGNSTGVYLRDVNDVIVENLIVKNFDVGINLSCMDLGSRNNTIEGNTLDGDKTGIMLGLMSTGNTVDANIVENGTYGIYISTASGNTLRNNRLSNNKYNLCFDWELTAGYVNTIDESNLVNGKPVIFWVNEHDKIVPSNAGFVGLVDCQNITVKDLKISHNNPGILLDETSNSQVTQNQLTNNSYGIVLRSYPGKPCDYNQIKENRIIGNAHDGVMLDTSHNISIIQNVIMNNEENGIVLFDTNYVSISDNILFGNMQFGLKIWGYESYGNSFTKNSFVRNIQHTPSQSDEQMIRQVIYGQAEITEGTVEINGCNGNYWSDYNGSDLNGDGIGDSAYTIRDYKIGRTYEGTHLIFDDNSHFDSSPLMHPWGSPILIINSPENGSIVASYSLSLNLTIIQPNSLISYRLDGQEEVAFTQNTTLKNLSVGLHSLVFCGNDSYGNIAPERVTFTIESGEDAESSSLSVPITSALSSIAAIVLVATIWIGLVIYIRKRKR